MSVMTSKIEDMERRARSVARAVLVDKKQGKTLPTDLSALIADEGVELRYFDSERRFDGRIETIRGRPTIFVNGRHRERCDGRTRFTLAHEIAHHYLHRTAIRSNGCISDERIDQDAGPGDPLEFEANKFASECLLPTTLLTDEYGDRMLALSVVEELASRAQISLQSAAIGLTSLSSDCCCILFEVAGVIKWTSPSDDWRYRKLPSSSFRGQALPSGSASSLAEGSVPESQIELATWIPNQPWREESLFESARGTAYGRLILLGCDEA